MIYKCSNAYYFRSLQAIGGIESHLYYIGKKYGKKYDISVFYNDAEANQLARISKYVRCIQIDKTDVIHCNTLFVCFNREILNQVVAKKTYLVLHGDYKDMVKRGQLNETNLPIDKRVDGYLGVSQLVCDSFEELTGVKPINVYEPVELDKIDKPLLLVSATRLTAEKGWNRMVQLAEKLDENNVNYQWFIYTNTVKKPTKNMVFLQPRLDITNLVGGYSAYVQLSDNEGYCLSIVEALTRGVPVIATDLPVLKELGLNDKNSIILPMDMSNIPVDRIKNITDLKFTYKQPKDKWEQMFDTEFVGYEEVKVRILPGFRLFDTHLNRYPSPGETVTVPLRRYEQYLKYEEKTKKKIVELV